MVVAEWRCPADPEWGGRNTSMNMDKELHSEEMGIGSDSSSAIPARPVILLADDSPQIRTSLSRVLHQSGYKVVLVAHGGQVLDRALSEHFDLLLLDLNMPELDGWRTLGHLRTLKPELPVLIITAQPGQRQWAAAEGAGALLEKPLDLPVLLETIRKLLEGEAVGESEERDVPHESFRFDQSIRGRVSSANHDFVTAASTFAVKTSGKTKTVGK